MENKMIIPTGIMHTPVVNISWPDYMNFGTIGSTIGHEITHNFDGLIGSAYDEDGNGN